jgi:putative choline sulfate-utilization transcription factor
MHGLYAAATLRYRQNEHLLTELKMARPSLRRSLPPLNSLVAFEAAGRLESFTAAGRELGLTQAAISRQIQQLEGDLGVLLFSRSRRGMRLTPEGDILYRAVTAGLTSISDTAMTLRQQQGRRSVTIGASLGFSTFWVMPRLPGFRSANPSIDLRLISSDALGDLAEERIDMAIRYGDGHWPALNATRMFGGEMFPVVSPSLLKGKKLPLSVEEFCALPLLEYESADPRWLSWEDWAQSLPQRPKLPAARIRFNSYPLLIQAAIAGEGVGLGWRYFVDEFLHDQRLVRPVEEVLMTEFAFHLVEPIGARPRTATTLLRKWLLDRARESEATLLP